MDNKQGSQLSCDKGGRGWVKFRVKRKIVEDNMKERRAGMKKRKIQTSHEEGEGKAWCM